MLFVEAAQLHTHSYHIKTDLHTRSQRKNLTNKIKHVPLPACLFAVGMMYEGALAASLLPSDTFLRIIKRN